MSYASSGYGPSQSGRPMNGRLIVALIIAVIGVAMYFFDTQTNPVTGKKQHVAMDVNQEIKLGLDSAPQMAAEMGGVADPREDPRARLVDEVGQRIVRSSDARRSPYVNNYHF